MADEEGKEYRWETGYEKTWEAITEDASGSVAQSVQELVQKARRQRQAAKSLGGVRLGMMRHLYVVLDASENMSKQDLKPTRMHCAIALLESFLEEFFYLNPISQAGLIVTRNKRAEIVSSLAGNQSRHLEQLNKLRDAECRGEPSLQNSLELAISTLRHMPAHASRELLLVMGSLTTCDPGDVVKTIDTCRELRIRASVIALAAEVRIFRELTRRTGGEFNVILDDVHFKDVLHALVEPPPTAMQAEAALIKMGFPCHSGQSESDGQSGLGMCFCCLDVDKGSKLSVAGFLCPQCNAKYCELPVECGCCGLTLVSAPHLARSFHHLFPLPTFKEVTWSDHEQSGSSTSSCFGCTHRFTPESDVRLFICPKCKHFFCSDCDLFIHETLHTCPGCSSSREVASTTAISNGH